MIGQEDSLSARAYEQIKQMIMSGELAQGQTVSINAMAGRLSISRTPVTNACQRLALENLLTIVSKQGVIINSISLEDAYGIYELRAAIESYCAKRIAGSSSPDDLLILEKSIEKQDRAIQSGDIRAFMDEDHFFHRYLLQMHLSPAFLSVIGQLYDRAYMLGISNNTAARLSEAVEEHKAILAALQQKDGQALSNAIENNILNGFRSLTRRYMI